MGNSGEHVMRVYLDHHSTTPCDPRVVEEMLPFFTETYGNPSSPNAYGEEALEAVELARERVATSINAEPEQIYFTSSATEANNIVLRGMNIKDLIISSIEHSSVLKTAQFMKDNLDLSIESGLRLVNVNEDGMLDLDDFQLALNAYYPGFVSIIMANNEVGTVQDIQNIVKMCKDFPFTPGIHTDAAQALGKIDIDVKALGVDFLTMSSHKIYGPKGVGALYCKREDYMPDPLVHGGYQSGLTSGTLNVPAIVGFGKACELATGEEQKAENERLALLRDYLLDRLKDKITGIQVNGSMESRLPNNLNISIDGVPSEAIIVGMDDVIVSGGAACQSSGRRIASHVLLAMGVKNPDCAIRFGLGRWTTPKEIEYAVDRIAEVVNDIRG